MTALTIRPVRADDAAAIAEIYAHHVLHGTATFDIEPHDASEWERRIAALLAKGAPFLVAEDAGTVAGYAYAAQFRDRAAYAETCEDSIYIARGRIGQGVGKLLLGALMPAAYAAGFRQMLAVIGGDEPGSVALHTRLGFTHAGRMRNVGRKFGRLLDTVYMQAELKP